MGSATLGERGVQLLMAAGAASMLVYWYVATERLGGAPTGEAITAFGRVTGLLGAYASLVLLVLMARVPWLERTVGLVRLASWHRYLGTTALVLIIAHVVATAWGYALVLEGTFFGELWTMIVDLPGMITATVATVLLVLVALTSARAIRRRLPYGLWWLIHLTTYVAIVLGFSHQLDTGDDFYGRPELAIIWKGMVIAAIAAVAYWRIARPLADAWARRTRVSAVEPCGGGISIWLEGDGAQRKHIRGGGFVLVRFLKRGLWTTARPYSITEVGEGDRFRLVVRRRPGRTTDRLLELTPGTRAIVEGPFGDLDRVRVPPGEPALLIGAGSGITPLHPLARGLAAGGHDVVVVNRASAADAQCCGDDLRALAANGGIVLHDVFGTRRDLGKDPLDAAGLTRLVPDLAGREVVVCTPPDLTARLVRSAREAGVPDERIHMGVFAL